MARGKNEEHNPKRRPRKPSDPIPNDELMDALKEAFPGSEEYTDKDEKESARVEEQAEDELNAWLDSRYENESRAQAKEYYGDDYNAYKEWEAGEIPED